MGLLDKLRGRSKKAAGDGTLDRATGRGSTAEPAPSTKTRGSQPSACPLRRLVTDGSSPLLRRAGRRPRLAGARPPGPAEPTGARSCPSGTPRSTGGSWASPRPWTGGSASSTRRSTAGSRTPPRPTNKIHERLGKVDEATTQMLERAKDLARLEQALRPPKARGGFGELLLENLLRDRLPPSAYEMQYTFDSRRAGRRGRRAPTGSSRSTRSSRSTTSCGWSSAENDAERQLAREGSSAATSSSTSTRSRPSTSVPTRAPTTSPSCTSRSRRSTTSSPAARPARCSRTRTNGASSRSRRRRSPRTCR